MGMKITRLVAVRHGETAWNVDTRIQGQLDIGLNDNGRWQARRVAQALIQEPVHAIYASDLQRAWHTAQSISESTGTPVRPESGLRERRFGLFEGKTFQEIEAAWPELQARYGERFRRMWRYYLLSCAGFFRSRQGQLWQLVLSRRERREAYRSLRPFQAMA